MSLILRYPPPSLYYCLSDWRRIQLFSYFPGGAAADDSLGQATERYISPHPGQRRRVDVFDKVSMGVAHYRAGDWKAGAAALEKSVALRQGGYGLDWFFLAIAHGRLDRTKESWCWYD
jgi:hypothetical protein